MGKGLVIGIIVVVIVLIGGYFLFSGQQTTQDISTDDQGVGPSNGEAGLEEASISLLSYPSTATSGEEVTFSWSVDAPANAQFTHTAIHYSTASQSGNYGLVVTPGDSGYSELTTEYASGDFQAGTFETTLTITETTYFRAHAIINGNNYWIDEEIVAIPSIPFDGVITTEIREFTMTAKKWDFTPSIITVNEGDIVRLTIESIDVNHGFAITAFGVSETLSPGNTVNVEFVANQKGTFSFFCTVPCGSGHSTMKGTLIVE